MSRFATERRSAYQVRLPIFEGPLDALLHMLRERRLDITLVSLVAITSDFVAYVQQLDDVDPRQIADFLVIAAEMVWLKTRVLLPNAESVTLAGEEPDPTELLRRLEAYQAFKEAAGDLANRWERRLAWYEHEPITPQRDIAKRPFSGLTLQRLFETAERTLRATPASVPHAPEAMKPVWMSLEACVDLIHSRLATQRHVPFVEVVGEAPTRDRVTGIFLGVLHLWKEGSISVAQAEPFGAISLQRVEENGAAD